MSITWKDWTLEEFTNNLPFPCLSLPQYIGEKNFFLFGFLQALPLQNGLSVRKSADTCAAIYWKIGTLFRGRKNLQPLITLLK